MSPIRPALHPLYWIGGCPSRNGRPRPPIRPLVPSSTAMNASLLASLALAIVGGLTFTLAQQDAPATPKADPARQFDFWVGDWECYGRDGTLAGTNEVTLGYKDRVLQEHWEGASGSRGTSLNMYNPSRGAWHQTWCDDNGTLLLLDGGLDDEGAMVLEGRGPKRPGGAVLHRVVWTPKGDNVQQTWTMTADGGKTWKTLADLEYRPAKDAAEGESSDE